MKKNTLFFPFFWKWINLIEKVVKIEETIYNKYKGESPYTNRVLEILYNLKTNEEFKQNIVVGKITPDDLATMDVIDMVDKTKRKEINKAIENKVNSVRSDWEQKHAKVTSGVYKCGKCGCDKTTQHELCWMRKQLENLDIHS